MTKCSVCINTYKRPFLLKKLLNSLNTQLLDESIQIEIIVADNDPEKSAESIIQQSVLYLRFPLNYFIQPLKNISLTRNVAVSHSTGDYILFIDDDEYADDNWISSLINCAQKYNCDAVFGKVIPYFDENAPKWALKCDLFARPCNKTGEIPKFTYTSNCLVKTNVIKSVEGPFDPDYGLTGGEDTLLFGILHKKGYKFTSCNEAIVYDYFPPERTSLKWLLKRGFRTGNSFSRRSIYLSKNMKKTKPILFIKAALSIVFYSIMMLVTFFIPKFFIYWLIRIFRKAGHIAAIFNYYHEEYRSATELNLSGTKRKHQLR